MSESKSYTIVQGSSAHIEAFIRKVNLYIDKGYLPIGGAIFYSSDIILQTLYKKPYDGDAD